MTAGWCYNCFESHWIHSHGHY